jgi:molecular chaperone GrpE
MVLDLHDALSVAKRQMEKAKAAASDLRAVVGDPPTDVAPGAFRKFFGSKASPEWANYFQKIEAHYEKLRDQFSGVSDGYTMSLRRIERVFPQLGLTPLDCVGATFNPEVMEVLDTEPHAELPTGTVLEVVRAGYRWNGAILRCAQVKVVK